MLLCLHLGKKPFISLLFFAQCLQLSNFLFIVSFLYKFKISRGRFLSKSSIGVNIYALASVCKVVNG